MTTSGTQLLVEALDEFAALADAIAELAGAATLSTDLQRKLPGMVKVLASRLGEGLRALAEQFHEKSE